MNGHLEYRILTNNRTDMIGPNHGIPVHISKLEAYFPVREHFSYRITSSADMARYTCHRIFYQFDNRQSNLGILLAPLVTVKTIVEDVQNVLCTRPKSRFHGELYHFPFDDIFVGQAIAENISSIVGSNDYTFCRILTVE